MEEKLSTNPLEKLVHELSKLPSVGEKTAMRLALHILRQPREFGHSLAKSLTQTLESIRFCEKCYQVAVSRFCLICSDVKRNANVICVVEEVADLIAIEKTRRHRGLYHVLHGSISPLDGIGPEQLKIAELIERLRHNTEQVEVILATNPDVNGDVTAVYLAKLLRPLGIRITKLASGIPMGGHIEYIDSVTLSRAMEQRVEY